MFVRDDCPPVPNKSDKLFRNDLPDFLNNAVLMSAADNCIIGEGFERAASALWDQVCADREGQDFLVFPIIFLWRHRIEILLKDILGGMPLVDGSALSDQECGSLKSHQLLPIWEWIEKRAPVCCQLANTRMDQDALDGVKSYLVQISDSDPDSFAFRYAFDKKGYPSIPPAKRKQINLRHLGEMMVRLVFYLRSIDEMLRVTAEHRQ